jgi:hypothetical protein
MITDPETGWTEATIAINEYILNFAEAMSLRVAVSTFRIQLQDPAFRMGIGPMLAGNYDAHLQKIEELLVQRKNKQ